MKQLLLIIQIILISFCVKAQSTRKSKTILDKTYQIDSAFQPYFGIQQIPADGIAVIDEQALNSNKDNTSFSILHATNDPFTAAHSYQFSALHMRSKGLPANFSSITLNGIAMVDLANGTGLWNHWQGINQFFRIDEQSNDFIPNSFAVSTVGTSSNIDLKISKLKAQNNLDIGFSNRTYNHQIQFAHSSGLLKHGWAFAYSIGAQYTSMPAVMGVFHNALNGFIGMSKQWQHQFLSIIVFANDFKNARQASTLKETSSLFQDPLYNPNWGYQQQQIRSANTQSQLLPVSLLTHEWKFSNQSFLQTAISFSAGYKNTTGLNWFHAADPRPDYYRNLPSFQSDPVIKKWVAQTLIDHRELRQIQWDKLYAINQLSNETIYDANGIIGNTIKGKMARYLLENRRIDIKRIYGASSFHGRLGDAILYDLGLNGSLQKQHFYKTVNDLLGANFFVNWNQFAENEIPNHPSAIQFDVNVPNRIVKNGEAFGYDYQIIHTKLEAWFSAMGKFRKFRISLSGQLGTAQFWRIGNTVNGLFPDQSYGKSAVNQFAVGGLKAVINYAINGKQNLYLTAGTAQNAPSSDNCFISPSTRNDLQENIKNEMTNAFELAYIIQSKKLKMHAALYYVQSFNGMDILSFYHDTYNSFVNDAIRGIDQIHLGFEFGIEAKLNSHFSFLAAATKGQHYFSSRQFVTVTVDNDATELERAIIYAKNYPSINSPQAAYSLSFNFRSNYSWLGSISASLFDQQYIGWNPLRRTAAAMYPIDPTSAKGQSLLQVERLPAQSLFHFFIRHNFKSAYQRKGTFSCSLGINNLLNQTDMILAGYEQLRFDFDNKDPNKFPAKYLHATGRNFLLSLHYSF